jgi:hypothetical protein
LDNDNDKQERIEKEKAAEDMQQIEQSATGKHCITRFGVVVCETLHRTS